MITYVIIYTVVWSSTKDKKDSFYVWYVVSTRMPCDITNRSKELYIIFCYEKWFTISAQYDFFYDIIT